MLLRGKYYPIITEKNNSKDVTTQITFCAKVKQCNLFADTCRNVAMLMAKTFAK